MTSVHIDSLPTIDDLIEYLEQPERRKTKGQFADGGRPEARCCLGHYCHLAGFDVRPDQLVFSATEGTNAVEYVFEGEYGPRDVVALPADHWLFAYTDSAGNPEAAGLGRLQEALASENDGTDDFTAVINVLRTFKAAQTVPA